VNSNELLPVPAIRPQEAESWANGVLPAFYAGKPATKMSVLIPRTRMLAVRLTVDEYTTLEKFCVQNGARSISDLARNAICSFVNRTDPDSTLLASLNQNSTQVKELQQRLEMLAGELATLKAAMPMHAPKNDGAGEEEDECSEEQSLEFAASTKKAEGRNIGSWTSVNSLPGNDNASAPDAED
jgi:hypothetical protein